MPKHLLAFVLLSTPLLCGATTPSRVISLSPHLTEWMFALQAQEALVAVSDYSDYPAQARTLPRVASHNGVNFEAVMRLKPDLILAWQGGNKTQDLAKLNNLGLKLFYSEPKRPQDIPTEMLALGELLGKSSQANKIASTFTSRLQKIKQQAPNAEPVAAFYYMWSKPLMTIGSDAWANQLLSTCGAINLFADSFSGYPEVTMEQVIRRRPQTIIAAMKTTQVQVETFWQTWQPVLNAKYVVVNPDLLHRFTPRLLDGLADLCHKIHQ